MWNEIQNLIADIKRLDKEIQKLKLFDIPKPGAGGGGSGDMKKSTYDTDNDGQVEAADYADTVGNHDHSGDAGDGGTFPLVNLQSTGATVNQVPLADGSGGIDWGDQSAAVTRVLVAYNYTFSDGVLYRIGLVGGPDERHLSALLEPAFALGGAGAWDDYIIKDPCLLDVNGVLYLYYTGNGSYPGANKIGLARSFDGGATWVKYASNPVLDSGVAWENGHVSVPAVIYDREEATAGKKFKMWYAGDAFGAGGIGYAYSADGISWTKYASNPVIALGAGGQWDDNYVNPAYPVRLGGTYYLFYNGNNGSGTWQGGLATFTDPEGTYTKSASNPTLVSDGITSAISSNVGIGDTHIHVSDATVFPIGAAVWVYDAGDHYLTHVTKQDSTTQITVADAAPVGISSTGGNVRSVAYNSVNIKSAVYDGGWRFGLTGFQPLDGSGDIREIGIYGYSKDLTKIYIDYGAGMILPLTLAESQETYVSRENPAILPIWREDDRFQKTLAPAAHASTHASGGSDAVKLDDLSVPDDNTDLNASTSKHGLLLKLGGGTTNFLRADGSWQEPPGGSGTDADAVHVDVANEISGITEKVTLADDDLFIIEDSAAAGVKKKVKKSNLPGAGSGVTRNGATTDHHLAVWNGANADSIEDGGVVPSANEMPWLVDIIGNVSDPSATTGTWVSNYWDPSTLKFAVAGSGIYNSSNAQNDAISWDVVLAAGTWNCTIRCRKSTNTAIFTLNQDGASMGTADSYAASSAAGDLVISGFTVSTSGKHTMQFKAASRNASNTTGWYLEILGISFRRTA